MRRYMGEAPVTQAAAGESYEEVAASIYDVTLTANQQLFDQGIFVDPDSDFKWLATSGSQTGAYQIRIKLPNGRYYPNTFVRNANFIGTAQFPVPVEPGVIFPAGGKLALDIQDLSGAGNTIQIIFYGARLYRTR